MKWITRERIRVGRIGCAWLIKRFIDPGAEFVFVSRGTEVSAVTDGTPFHMTGAELANQNGRGTFEVIADAHGLTDKDPVLVDLGQMVRAADAIHIDNAEKIVGLDAEDQTILNLSERVVFGGHSAWN